MKIRLIAFAIALVSARGAVLPLVPLPASVETGDGPGFRLSPATSIAAAGPAAIEAEALAARLRASTGYSVPVKPGASGVSLALDPSQAAKLGAEGYLLESSASGVRITAAAPAGLFYGGQTLLQLLPPEVFSKTPVKATEWTVPAVKIEDRPRFAWRGFMFDEARQFFGKEHMLKLIDSMALHKMNRLHWHLTDDEGWRIDIKAYPKLTSVGAWRGTECALPNPRKEQHKRYGGFYTQAEMKEIVAYAKARHIEIMPEVDLPGHSLAAVTAYPELLPEGNGGGVSAQGFKGNALSPAKEETYRFIETVFDELKTVFPYEYIHIGGDEVNHQAWQDCPQIKQLMRKEKLGNLHEVQVHFTKRLERIFAARGKRIFGWNEVLDARLDRGTGIIAWTGTGPGYQAAKMGFPVVMAPGQHCYFDMVYPDAQGEPPSHWWAGPVSCRRAYAFDPLGDGGDLPADAKSRIMGIHAALWTEFVQPWKGDLIDLPTYSAHADYKTWPRLAAIAEIGWTPQAARSIDGFEERLGSASLRRLGMLGVTYRIPVPTATHKGGKATITPPFPGADVRYTLDGSVPTAASPQAGGTIDLTGKDPSKLRARTFLDGRGSTMLAGATPLGAAEWTPSMLGKPGGITEFDLSKELTSPGIWRATFRFTSGTHALEISDTEILVNGQSVSRDTHAGRAGGQHRDNTWRFEIPDIPAGAKIILRANLRGDGGNDSRGVIVLTKSDRLEPAATVACNLPGYGESTAPKCADWDDATLFWIGGYPKSGDTVTWTFDEPVRASSISIPTGERGSTKDQAVGAVLEYSADGATWTKLADYAYGNAEGTLPDKTAIRALRIRFTATQKTWVMVRDPVIR